MHLVQILLPMYDNDGAALPKSLFAQVRAELLQQEGGLTAYTRAPASGLWQEDTGKTVHDDVVIYEVMTQTLDRAWWQAYRASLEQRFRQESVIVRAHPIVLL